jgi:UDP-N-acetyl-D-galactosamine dehydrogenase
MFQELIDKKKKLAVIGLGYVGLPIALEFAKKVSVIGFDINIKRLEMMRKNIDPNKELHSSAFQNKDIFFTNDIEALKQAHFFIVAVPTPIDKHNTPDLRPLISASETIGKVLKKGRLCRVRIHNISGLHGRRLFAGARKNFRIKIRKRFQTRLFSRAH